MPSLARRLKKLAMKPVGLGINRINFVKILKMAAQFEPGRTFLEKAGPPQVAFPNQEELILHTIELTMADFRSRGERAQEKEIEDYARSISCRYDHEIHTLAKSTMFNALAHTFEHDSLDRIFISPDQRELKNMERLRQARRDGIGVVYLVNHSSHWDEFIVDVVLEQHGVNLPLFAAGSNMMATPSIEKILMIGSYVIIRRGATKTYLATLFNYCRSLAELGQQQGIFLEAWSGGARTRDGSLRYPRRLVSLQGALASEKDVLIQPVVISYSAVPEDLGLSERAGGLSWINGAPVFRKLLLTPHRPLTALARSLEGLYGRAYINFCQPKLLSELDQMRAADPADLARDEFAALYSMKEIAKDKKVMSSQLAARGLVRARHDGLEDLVEAAQAELESVMDYHRRTFGREPDLEDFIRDNPMEEVVRDGLRTLIRRKVVKGKPGWRRGHSILAENGLLYYATHGDRRLYSPSAKENIVVVGAGAWGFSTACLIGRRILEEKRYLNSSLTLFDPREELTAGLIDTRVHPVHFPKFRLPKNVFPNSDAMASFRKATDVIMTSPLEFFETDMRRVLEEAQQALNVVIITRGFDQTSHRMPIQIAQDVVHDMNRSDVNLLVLSGPVTPKKFVEGEGGVLTLAGPLSAARALADLFRWQDFAVHVCDDPIGVQIAGAMSEVYSLLGAYLLRTKELSGRGRIAAFVTETSAEVIKLAQALGGKRETFLPDNPAWAAEYVAAGMGGPGAAFGREAGRSLAKARLSARDFLQQPSRDLMEEGRHFIGYTGIRSAYLTAKRLDLEMPRLRQAYRIFWIDALRPEEV
ncbi:MAG: 1-acyl-sn-glycerol-3-phosphate acyltransferase [Pseudomonadota bacterium]